MSDLAQQIADLPPEKRALLFEKLQQQADRKSEPRRAEIPRISRTAESFQLSFAQQRLWFLNQYEPESAEYNVPQSYRLRGNLQPELLQRALDALVERHESLRTTFKAVDGEGVQVIAPSSSVTMPLVDLRPRPEAERFSDAMIEISADAQQPFDLTRGPLVRGRLFCLEDREYLLYLNVHHITFDGWSHGVLIGELTAIYEALAGDRPSALAEMPIQYLDFAVWQRDWLQGEELAKQINYWKKHLEAVPPLEMPTDRPRPALRSHKGTTYPVELSESLSQGLEALSREADCTLFVILMAAFRTLLYRYSGQNDFAVGTLIANRTRPEIEGLIGFFANTLVLRRDLSDRPSFRELLRQERDIALDAYSHQDLPFEKLVDELQPERDLSRTPFFQVMLILQNAPTADRGDAAERSVELSPLGVDSRTAKFDLTLYMEQTEPLKGFLEYNTDLFATDTAARLVRHFLELLEGVVADPDRRLGEYELMAEEERRRILVEWNATAADYPRDRTVYQLFEERAAARPDDIALIAERAVEPKQEKLTYRELNERANRLARHLMEQGVGPEVFVGICTDRSSAMVVALLAVLKAGCAYLPLDPDYPADRLGFMLEDTGAPLVLTQAPLVEKLPKHDARVVLLDRDEAAWSGLDADNLAFPTRPDQLAYVIHTSGSTGKPKGVPVPHGALVNFLTSMARRPGISRDDTLLAVTTLSFDIAGLELYLPLVTGARLVVASREVASAGEQLVGAIKSSGATVMQATPATWRLLLDGGWPGDGQLKVLCGGEALPQDLGEQLLTKCASLWNVYGPTEATIWSTLRRVEAGDGVTGTVSIGRPLDNTQIYLLDPDLRPVPVGVLGELHIGGAGLARGYLNRPDLAAERFIPDPFAGADDAGARLYKTGDLVRYLPDGSLSFFGRIDQQVKVRGFRIELGEIESVLSRHPAIGQAVVTVREDTPGARRMVAYMVPGPKVEAAKMPNVTELRDFLKVQLPEYMVPALFVPLEALPLTPNGKVNRRALPKPDPSLLRSSKEYVAPRNGDEETMAGIWAEILGVEKVGINDDFFELGGDSLMVIRVVSNAKKAGLSITTRQVFQHRTIAELTAVVGTAEILAEQGLVTGAVPLTPAQLHFLSLGHAQPQYHSLGAFLQPKDGVFDRKAVAGALAKLLEHHDTLRMHLPDCGGEPGLVGDPPPETVPLSTFTIPELPEEEETKAFETELIAFARSFDLATGPLTKGALFEYADKPPVLFLMGHFLVADIGSWQTLLEDFDTAYRQLSRGETLELQPKTTAFKQWVEKLTERARGEEMKEERNYWLMEERQDTARMPFDFPEGENLMKTSKSVRMDFEEDETKSFLLEIPRASGAQIDAILLTGVLYAFERWTGTRSLLIDLLGHGREPLFDNVDLTRTVGWLNSIYPAYLTLGDAATPVAAMKSINDQLRAIPNGGIGYGVLRYLLRDPEIIARFEALPEPQIFFNYFGPEAGTDLSVLKKLDGFGGYGLDRETHRLRPLAVGVYVNSGKLQVRWEYSTNVNEHATIEALAERCREVLVEILEHHQREQHNR